MIASQLNGKSISWQQDYDNRVNPTLMTRLLHEAIPVLKSVDWHVTEVREGACTSELPLCFESTNQHGTHQAALISLSADYTGGLALATLLRGIPLSGVHHCEEDGSVALWLASMKVKYRNPSTGHLRATCVIPEDVARMVRRRYFAGKRVLVSLPVVFTSNDELVAEAEMKYFAQPSTQLKPTKQNPSVSPLYKHKLKASARMIAGLRAGSTTERLRIDMSHDRHAAGPHGLLLAKRLQNALPQLQDMVTARTRHIDEMLGNIPGLEQVVILGIGLDMRPFRLFRPLNKPMFFELDLPEMLEERSRIILQIKERPVVRRRMVACDFRQDDVGKLLMRHPDFDPKLPTAVIYEGCSMYFDAQENREVLTAAANLLQHPDSRLWCDVVTESVVQGTTSHPEIVKFLDGMEELGEQFIFGSDAPQEFLSDCGFSSTSVTSAQDYLGCQDHAFSTYQFAVSKR